MKLQIFQTKMYSMIMKQPAQNMLTLLKRPELGSTWLASENEHSIGQFLVKSNLPILNSEN